MKASHNWRNSIEYPDDLLPTRGNKRYDDYDDDYGEEEEIDQAEFERQTIERMLADVKKKYIVDEDTEEKLVQRLKNIDFDIKAFFKIELKKFKLKKKETETAKPKDVVKVEKREEVQTVYQQKMSLEQIKEALKGQKKYHNIVVVGHVDSGKSTIVGQMLRLLGSIDNKQFQHLKHEAEKLNKNPLEALTWISNEGDDERIHGNTITISAKNVETDNLVITILDAPGHRDYVPNMIAGAALADTAIFVANCQEKEVNISGGQSLEHLMLCRALGVSNYICVVNKMDLSDYSEVSFEYVQGIVKGIFKGIGMEANVSYVPVSAINEDVILDPTKTMSWYKGQPLLTQLDNLVQRPYPLEQDFVMTVTEYIQERENTIFGRIDAGYICKGDKFIIQPTNGSGIVKSIKVYEKNTEKNIDFAVAGQIVHIVVNTNDYIDRGYAVCSPNKKLPTSKSIRAIIRTSANLKLAIPPRYQVTLYRQSTEINCTIKEIVRLFDGKGREVKSLFIPKASRAEVIIDVESETIFDLYSSSKSFGSFILRDLGETIGFGTVIGVNSA